VVLHQGDTTKSTDILNSPFGKALASLLAAFWEFEREQPFLHSHALLGNLPVPSEWAMIYADWYNLIKHYSLKE